MHIQTLLGFLVLGLFLLAFAVELLSGRLRHSPRPGRDFLFTLTGLLSQGMISGALIGSVAGVVAVSLWGGEAAGSLSYIPFWIAFLVIFLGEEMLHYWNHRYAHEWRWLQEIHRTHHAHHAYGKGAHPNGNYAVTLFIYDVIFGTAHIPNRRQTSYGLPISPRLHWAEELFWPLVRKPLLPKPVKVAPLADAIRAR